MWSRYLTLATPAKSRSCWLRPLCLIVWAVAWAMSASAAPTDQGTHIWFDQPASDWEREGLPIGNGAMGAVIQGGVALDQIQFNEKTLWTGGPGSTQGYDFGLPKEPRLEALAKVRKTLEAQGRMKPEAVAQQLGNKITGYGDYQTFGDLLLEFPSLDGVSHYRRELDVENAVARVTFSHEGVNYSREYFASYPDKVIVVRVTADQPGKIHFNARFQTPDNRTQKSSARNGRITLAGHLKDNRLAFEAQVHVINEGGRLSSRKEGGVAVSGANAATLILHAGTDYALAYPHYRSDNPHARVSQRVTQASKKTYQQLLSDHQADYRALFGRVSLDIGQTIPDKPTPQLLANYRKGDHAADRALEAIYFQFGRYLLIASSRAGSLPANLQGVWNHSTTPPWNADYHVNINLQMNYWPAEVTNLSETTGPLFDFVDALVEPGRVSAKKLLGADGWTLFLNTNIWGFTGVIEWPTAFWQPEAGAWLAQHYYEHYLFHGDEKFLRDRAYPVMKGAAQFWLDALIKDPHDGLLVVSPSYSPEQGDFTVAAAMSQQIVFDLLANVYAAAEQLGDTQFQQQVGKTLLQLDKGIRIGSWGQLQEWKLDLDDPKNDHRHVSHLFALHPGHQINNSDNQTLLAAARTTLNARGDGGTGWAQAWKVNLWARLLDGDRAHKLLGDQLTASTLPNLWDNHPPFQIDGNFGATAGMAEMLLQSQNREIHLLPALPKAWPTGSVTGLRARGDVTLAMEWNHHQLERATIKAGKAGTLYLRTPLFNKTFQLTRLSDGAAITTQGDGHTRHFAAQAGETYLLSKAFAE